jgi:hypothetical protein
MWSRGVCVCVCVCGEGVTSAMACLQRFGELARGQEVAQQGPAFPSGGETEVEALHLVDLDAKGGAGG